MDDRICTAVIQGENEFIVVRNGGLLEMSSGHTEESMAKRYEDEDDDERLQVWITSCAERHLQLTKLERTTVFALEVRSGVVGGAASIPESSVWESEI